MARAKVRCAAAMSIAAGAVADIAILGIAYLMLRAGAFVGTFVDRSTHSRPLAWLCGLAIAGAVFTASIPAIGALAGVQCRGDADYQACVEGD